MRTERHLLLAIPDASLSLLWMDGTPTPLDQWEGSTALTVNAAAAAAIQQQTTTTLHSASLFSLPVELQQEFQDSVPVPKRSLHLLLLRLLCYITEPIVTQQSSRLPPAELGDAEQLLINQC